MMLFVIFALAGGLLTGARQRSNAAAIKFAKRRWKPVAAVVGCLALVAILGDTTSSVTADTRWIFAAAGAGWLIGRLLRHEIRTRVHPSTTTAVAVAADKPTAKR